MSKSDREESRLIRNLFTRASQDFLDLNEASDINLNSGSRGSVTQSAVQHGPDGKVEGKEGHPIRHSVRITSYRKRECDPDNLVGKFFIDSLRYAGIIHNDRAADIDYSITQKKVEKKESEKTLIEIWLL